MAPFPDGYHVSDRSGAYASVITDAMIDEGIKSLRSYACFELSERETVTRIIEQALRAALLVGV